MGANAHRYRGFAIVIVVLANIECSPWSPGVESNTRTEGAVGEHGIPVKSDLARRARKVINWNIAPAIVYISLLQAEIINETIYTV